MGSTAMLCGLAIVFGSGLANPVFANDLTWDSDPTTPTIQSGSGLWQEGGGSNQNWQDQANADFNNAANNNANTRFNDGDDVTFSDLGGGSANIDLDDPVAPGSMTFESGGYTIINADNDTDSINVGGTMGVSVGGGLTTDIVTIDAVVSNEGTINFGGTGTVVLAETNEDDGGSTAGTYNLNSGGLTITGSTAAEDAVVNNGGTLTLNGGGTILGTAASNAGTFNNINGDVEGLTTVTGGDVFAQGGDFTGGVQMTGGTMTVENSMAGSINNGDGVTGGVLTIDGGTTVTGNVNTNVGTTDNSGTINGTVGVAAGGFTNQSGANVTGLATVSGTGQIIGGGGAFSGGVAVNGGTFDVTANTTGNVTVDGGTANIGTGTTLTGTLGSLSGTTNNDGTISGNVTVTGGTLNNGNLGGTTPGIVDGDVLIDGIGAIVNNNIGSDITGTVTLDNGDGFPSGGTLNANGGTFGDVVVNDGTFNVNASTTADNVTNAGGDVLIETGGVTLSTDFNQTGGETRVAGGGTLTDTDGVVTISGGELLNNGGGTITSAVEVSGGTLTAGGGTFGGNVTISGTGTFNLDGFAVVGTTTITGGDINIGGPFTLQTDLVQSGGTTTINSGATLTDADGTTVAGGEIDNTGTITNDVTITNGTVTNNTLGIIGGVTTVQGGTLNASGGTFTGGVLAQGGAVNVTQSQTLDLTNQGSDITINSGITLTDDVINNDGTFTNNGTVAGTMFVDGGTVTQADGNITGLVTVTGTGPAPADTGTFVLEGGSIDTGATVQANGVMVVDGEAEGDIANNGGTVTLTENANLVGDVTNNTGTTEIEALGVLTGSLTVNGDTVTIAGDVVEDITDLDAEGVTVAGGTLITGNGADIQVVTTQTAGIITANGGDFSGGIVGQGGDININGNVGGDISVQGSALTIAAAGDLDGDVTMTVTATEAAVNLGTIQGTVFADGGVFENSGDINGIGSSNGVIVNGGTFSNNLGGVVDDPALVQSGTFLANGGSVTGDTVVIGTGQFIVTADSSGDVINGTIAPAQAGGIVTINTGQTLTGDVTNNSGTTTVNGEIDGTLDVVGGVVATGSSSAVTELATVSGGTLNANGGTFGEGILSTGGTTNVTGEITITTGALTSDDGFVNIAAAGVVNGDVVSVNSGGPATAQIDNNGTIDGTVTANAGIIVNYGTVTGEAIVNGGELASSGALQDGFTVNGGVLVLFGAGTIAGAGTVNSGGAFLVNGGTFNDGVDNEGGIIEIAGNSAGVVRNNDGDARINPTVTFTGDVINGADGTFNLSTIGVGTATIIGTLANNGGTVNLNGTITGGTTNTGATAQMTVDAGDVANFGSIPGMTNTGGATLTLIGTASGGIVNEASGNVEIEGGTLAAGSVLDNAGDTLVTGAAVSNGTVNNSGTMTVGDGGAADSLAVNGALTNQAGGTLTIADSGTVSATSLTNENGGTVELSGAISSALTNAGDLLFVGTSVLDDPDTPADETAIDPADATRLAGLVTNTADGNIILQSGQLTFGGGLSNTGTVDASSGRLVEDPGDPGSFIPATGDVVVINGGLSGNGTFVLDLDLSNDVVNPDGTGSSDYVSVSGGPVTGTITLSFNILGTGGEQDNDILVFQAAANAGNNFDVVMEGLPDPGEAVLYVPYDNGAGSYFVQDALNPGIGALAGSIVLTQSLIGSVINRPSSPFVSGLAYDDPDPCGPGVWTRGIGGKADSSGQITELNTSDLSFKGEIAADFYGLQAGGDLACFNGYFDGWDISIGGIGGFNTGTTSQPVYGLEGNGLGGLVLGDTVTSITDVDFDQTYAGVYVTGAYNRFSADLQYRLEQTNFVADNQGQNGSSGLGLDDSAFSSEAGTFSGSVSYAMPLGDTNFTFVPTGGFAYTEVSTDVIGFADGSSVKVEDFTSETLFVGGTISRTVVGQDGTSAINQFGTVTYYSDMADAPTSVFTPAPPANPGDPVQDPRSIQTENLGAYAELSAGLNYIRILPLDAPGGAKQFSASLRGDLRSSDQLDSWGVTGQLRLQF